MAQKIFHHVVRTADGKTLWQALSFREKAYVGAYSTKVQTLMSVDTPGESGSVEVVMTDEDKERFKEPYLAWKEGREAEIAGIPLDEITAFSAETIAALEADKIKTLEQLAAAPDSYCNRKEVRGWRDTAQKLIDTKKAAGLVSSLTGDLEALKEEVAELRKSNRELMESLGASEEAKASKKPIAKKRKAA